MRLTVWCSNEKDTEGFIYNASVYEMGLEALIARSWILQSDLNELIKQDR